MTPEEAVKAAVKDALRNEYEYGQIVGWVDDAAEEVEEEWQSQG